MDSEPTSPEANRNIGLPFEREITALGRLGSDLDIGIPEPDNDASRMRKIAYQIQSILIEFGGVVGGLSFGSSLLISTAIAQTTVGEECTTLLQNFAQNGFPLLQRWGVVITLGVAVVGYIMYGVHKRPDKKDKDIEYSKGGMKALGAVLLIPTLASVVLGEVFNIQLAECLDVTLGLF